MNYSQNLKNIRKIRLSVIKQLHEKLKIKQTK